MNWYKHLKLAKTFRFREEDDAYKKDSINDGTGFNLMTPGEDLGYGSDETDTKHPPEGFSATEERIRDRDIPKDFDGDRDSYDPSFNDMQGDSFYRTPDDPNSIEQQTERALNTDIQRDKRPGVHTMNSTIFDSVKTKLKGV